ncbi:hypothetical protein O7626_40470 [Micromonospora sp. WMMD1102]|uniref:hypothetical protein n=1 Tax=Micromonospora sp. WMMD1102 TaxID=3016105 RepID=UPI002414D419|nr:hypothetical protein [Micromonospora sp. WMMD1102]MDG4792094.1 hypothetical protein [Micromonospora sp. WMMD1102]
MSEQATPNGCTHPAKGGQERILGSGSGDYYCCVCDEPMPVISKPNRCAMCRSTTVDIAPDPAHGKSWRCAECGKNWGWVRDAATRRG